jgi:uncharacterized repeat protein (TIGR02543 family)
MVARGKVQFNGTDVANYPINTTAYQVNIPGSGGYGTISPTGGGSITVYPSSDGTSSFTVKLISLTGNLFGGIDSNSKPWGAVGEQSVSLATHRSTLTVNPNGGSWNGSTNSQSFYQLPSSTKAIANPTRSGYTFGGWAVSGTGSLSGTTYTFGSENTTTTLTAQWTPISYTVTCEDRLGDSSGLLLGSSTASYSYGTVVSGANFGSDTTPSAYYTGFKYSSSSSATVTGNITVYRYFAVNTYPLSVTKSDNGITVNISRLTSPYGGGSIGLLSNGATLYYGDTLSVSWAVQSGYMQDTLTVNSVDVSAETPPYPVTVSSSVTVVMTVKLGAIVYIENDLYQAFIYDGANWVQYEAYIYNGSSWDAY